MFAKVICGKTIRGILNYNEKKVKTGKAVCLEAVGFGCVAQELGFKEKLFRFTDLLERRKSCRTNAIHIILSFDPSEKPDDPLILQVADSYMEKLGFGEQPYLVYRHRDTKTSHIHIATTNITADGNRLETHFIGKEKSEVARKAIEEEFGLVKASEKEKREAFLVKPVDLDKIIYGEVETKEAISKVVRSVVSYYKFTSLEQLNTVLRGFNVIADRGDPGTRQYERGGLTYQIINSEGTRFGNSIKASRIYEKPTLKKLKELFPEKAEERNKFKGRMVKILREALQNGIDQNGFLEILEAEQIRTVFHTGKGEDIYGVTFVDDKTYCVFKGSDLGSAFSARAIAGQLASGNNADVEYNKQFVAAILAQTNYQAGMANVLERWAKCGLLVTASEESGGSTNYRLGHISTDTASYIPVPNLQAYFNANNLKPKETERLAISLKRWHLDLFPRCQPNHPNEISLPEKLSNEISQLFDDLFHATYYGSYTPRELLAEVKKKKRKRKSS